MGQTNPYASPLNIWRRFTLNIEPSRCGHVPVFGTHPCPDVDIWIKQGSSITNVGHYLRSDQYQHVDNICKRKTWKMMFYFFSIFIWLVGVAGEKSGALEWVHVTYSYLSTSPAGKDWIHQNMFHGNHENTEKAARGDAEQRFFCGSQPSGVESINPGANIVWACGALITLLHPLLHPSQILIRATQTKGAATNPVTTHDFLFVWTNICLIFPRKQILKWYKCLFWVDVCEWKLNAKYILQHIFFDGLS